MARDNPKILTSPDALPGPVVGGYAFWRYDRYPYALGGEITETFDGGVRFTVKGYGNGRGYSRDARTYQYLFLDAEKGAAVAAEIARLAALASKVAKETQRMLAKERSRAIPNVKWEG